MKDSNKNVENDRNVEVVSLLHLNSCSVSRQVRRVIVIERDSNLIMTLNILYMTSASLRFCSYC